MRDPLNLIPLTLVSRRPRWAFLVLLLLYFAGVLGLPCIAGISRSDAVVFMTGVVIILYAVDTHAMRKEITRQVDMMGASLDMARDAFKLNFLESYRQATAPALDASSRLGMQAHAEQTRAHQESYQNLLVRVFPLHAAMLDMLGQRERS